MAVKSVSTVRKQLEKRFPKVWTKPGEEFGRCQKTAVWSGEGSEMPDGTPAFSMYGNEPLYVMGVHKDLYEYLSSVGYFAEPYDGGTYFFYPI